MDQIFEGKLLNPNHNPELRISDGEWTVTPDRMLGDVYLAANGERWHSSEKQRAKDAWRDRVIVEHGKRIIHIPGQLLFCQGEHDSKKYWPYVKSEILKFIVSNEKVRYIPA